MKTPRVVDLVHFVPPDEGEHECHAAIVTGVKGFEAQNGLIGIMVVHHEGIQFCQEVEYSAAENLKGRTWHWPED